jgi:sorbose reductase
MGSLEGSTQEWAPMPKLSGSVMEMFNMKGRVAIITSVSGGIGYEATRALAEAGCNAASPHEME